MPHLEPVDLPLGKVLYGSGACSTSVERHANTIIGRSTVTSSSIAPGIGRSGRYRDDPDVVAGSVQLDARFESRPRRRNAGIDDEEGPFAADAQDAFDTRAVHLSGRSRVPGSSHRG